MELVDLVILNGMVAFSRLGLLIPYAVCTHLFLLLKFILLEI
jgi:hypothetical protein